MNDIYFASYADDSTLYKACDNVDVVSEILRMSAEKQFKWFKDNQMKHNAYRFHLILSTGDLNSLIKGILCEKFLDTKSDHKLAFDQNVNIFNEKAKAKLKALAGAVQYILLAKKNLLMNSYFDAENSYCSLIWMIHSHFIKNRVKYFKYMKDEFLLLHKNKNHNIYESYKSLNIPNGVFYADSENSA